MMGAWWHTGSLVVFWTAASLFCALLAVLVGMARADRREDAHAEASQDDDDSPALLDVSARLDYPESPGAMPVGFPGDGGPVYAGVDVGGDGPAWEPTAELTRLANPAQLAEVARWAHLAPGGELISGNRFASDGWLSGALARMYDHEDADASRWLAELDARERAVVHAR
jgi:hypothetical protein